ncbi:E3 ubiquitin-protein ligase UPL3-like isoform X1 [Impatiens glandulifera]|uniref:E3 ubiquitin-protein ligase UPL3-like isoform X1 n=2 Tax=Impatiens glandulifera TaxID=253017 RepID=UPI001FB0A30D|nr:E3 ubiquitin-protein ligase UPL3-like isoform X1 [Impatiens glandulifera]XP_047332592.1 E3 ubiquitin-protein ligase UPL3-like isoform X1 [Impatiens glandulifera]XP_047332593.1 E3 ubiquitin-protein ligase UPL3-like isoform X1 [Impatiens glandulifera]XP_047332596.1 E3 ubiquitin-protein ligase UPL3-like isoform X1 [Impatiens glandulifera]
METRSRKRAEATSSAPSSSPVTRSSKRARTSAAAAAAAAATPSLAVSTTSKVAVTVTTSDRGRSISTRSRGGRSKELSVSSTKMDSTNEPSGSGNRGGRRGRNNPAEKGKEKEHEVRVRDREREREIERNILEMEAGADEDDNDSEGAAGLLHQNLTSANSALQGLLRKLGAGLDDFFPPSAIASSSQQNGRLKKILSGLRSDGEEGKQVEALTQLCEMLSIGTEESLSSFSVDSFVPVLVGLLNHESNPDIMLLAARALTHLCDVLPSSCAAVVHYGAVSCLVARLLTIEYMDLAEQSLQALKKISQEHPTACLRAGALMAVLSYLDFFSTGVQRVALSTAANMCKKLPSDAADFVMEAVPLLTNLLQYHDAKVLEHASICLTRIVEAFASCPDRLDELCNHGLVTQAASLISTSNSGGGQASLSSSTYTGLIRLISTCASGSPLGAKSLLLLGISGILKDILSGSGMVANMSISPALSRPPEQICEIVNLANELLPPLPQGTISLPSSTNLLTKGSLSRKSSKQEDTNGSTVEISAREKLLNDQPELLQQFGVDLLPVMVQIYGSSVNSPVRHRCLSIIGKLMYFSSSDMIQTLMKVTNISSFLAGVLAWKDPQVLIPALQIADILMGKLPGTFTKMFVREGVIHAVDILILGGSTIASPAEKDSDSVSKTASRSRRSQRSKPDLHGTDDSKIPVSTVGSPPNSVEHPTGNLSMRVTVSASAKAFKDKYFPSAPGSSEVGITDDLVHLKNLCLKLSSGVDDQRSKSKGKSKAFVSSSLSDIPSIKEENLIVVVSEMLSELSKGDGVSTFEFIGSGVVTALLNYFSCGYFSKDRISEANLSVLRQQVIQRYKAFITISLPTSLDEGRLAPMSVLVQKLQNALASLERFPVVLSHSTRSSGGSARPSSGLSSLAQPFKLRLCRAQGEKLLRDYSSNVVLIDPLASLAAVEDFLWPRVQRNDSSQNPSLSANKSESKSTPTGASASNPSSDGRRHSSRSRTSVNIGETTKMDLSQEKKAGSSKGKGKAVLKPASEDPKGPQTRNARRRAALDRDIQMKHTSGDTTSEDDEPDVSPIDMDDALVIEDDEISDDEDDDQDDVLLDDSLPLCMPDRVHDVKLGDPIEENSTVPVTSDSKTNPAPGSSSRVGAVKDFDSTEFRSSTSFGSRGAMSFAAAAMAGLASANGRGIRGGRDRLGRPLVGSNDPPRLVFSAGGKQLNKNLTIYQAIQRQLVVDETDDERFTSNDFISSDGSRFWSDVYTITYQRADNQNEKGPAGTSNSPSASKSSKINSNSNAEPPHRVSLLDSILQGELPCDLEKSNSTYNILALLRVLEGLNQLSPRLRVQALMDSYSEGKISNLDILGVTGVRVPGEEFINSKLTPKLSRQIQDALALCSGSLPAWCSQLTKSCPFLFPFEIRRQYLYSTAFGLSRALHRLQQQGADGHGSSNEREVRVGRLQRQKVRVSRNRILDSAAKVMELYSSQKTVLEVEYFGEVGTGLGPTLEFYTLLSHDLQKASLGMWRSSFQPNKPPTMEVTDIAHSPLGLFPRPWAPNSNTSDGSQFSKVVEHFRLLGRVMAKALQDGRLLDLSFSTAFYKLVLGQDLELYDILSFDAELGRNLQELQTLVSRKHLLESSSSLTNEDTMSLHFRGVPVEDLCLDFTLPGHSDYVLKSGEETVDIDSLEEYISLVVDATVKTGITMQMEAFRAGFNQVFDISSLQIFSPHELDYLLCGRRELWKAETLVEHIKFDHGYTAKSPAIVNLLEIMGEFTPEHQRSFCQFVTGAPRLPPGGLAVLSPKLTIVRKHSSVAGNALTSSGNGASETADDDLPSVMTCANYLKLPPYSTKEIMYKKLLYAINEGQGSFDLS